MKRIHTVVIGAGQAGLALSRCLTERGVEHVLVERGRVAQRWSERWDSLRLLTPNWMTRLPGWQYRGADPDGFMKRDEVIAFLRGYARSFDAPVEEETNVLRVSPAARGWRVVTDRGTWIAENVVLATGHCHEARIPSCARHLSPDVMHLSTIDYRHPSQVPDGGVLVIGASASGVQLARELRRAGRDVTLAVGRHSRVPRRYRGRDIHYWLDRTGVMTRALSDMRDAAAARVEPSLQLAGGSESLDLASLMRDGVRLTGRIAHLDGMHAELADDLAASVADADRRMFRLLGRIDRHIAAHGAERFFPAEVPPPPVPIAATPQRLDLAAERIRTVLWATGYKRSYPWLHAPVLDANGEIRQTRGRTSAPGLYILGLQFMTRRNSSLIDGVGRDAEEIAEQIARGIRAQKEAA
jgi:putative flavoprotein involved in K+ transport